MKEVVNWQNFLTEDAREEELTGHVEIFKLGDKELSEVEDGILKEFGDVVTTGGDDSVAVDLTPVTNDFNVADDLVNLLNEISGKDDWYVADPTEEMVYL